jgi:hypothetical protein
MRTLGGQLKEAFLKSASGRNLVMEVKEQKIETRYSAARRYDELSSLVAGTFPAYFGRLGRVDDRVAHIAEQGGKRYDDAILTVKHAKSSEIEYKIAENMLIG